MPIVLSRVDDRLIHGQVVIGWGLPLRVQVIALVDDTIRANPWEQDIYRMATPETVQLEFVGCAEAAACLRGWDASPRNVLLLTGDLATMAALVEAGEGVIRRVNLGGLHQQPGRRERLRYLYLSDAEVDQLRRLEAGGTAVFAQDLPTAPAVPLREVVA